MCAENKASLQILYSHLAEAQALLAVWLTDVPRDMLAIFDEVLRQVVFKDFKDYANVRDEGLAPIIFICSNLKYFIIRMRFIYANIS